MQNLEERFFCCFYPRIDVYRNKNVVTAATVPFGAPHDNCFTTKDPSRVMSESEHSFTTKAFGYCRLGGSKISSIILRDQLT
jgi:hypothetical protein